MIGSVKSNIGHTESAAGTAGLIKILLMMKHGQYVPSLHVKADKSNLNPNLDLLQFGLEIPLSVHTWSCNENGKRHACLNSFGFGGSNSHAIITQRYNRIMERVESNQHIHANPISISGIDKESLKQNLLRFHDDIDTCTSSIFDIAYTSFHHRDIYQYRTLVYGENIQDIQRECKNRVQQIEYLSPRKKSQVIFVYCGVGTTWPGMCHELMQFSDIFKRAIQRIDNYLEPLVGWKIGEQFAANSSFVDPFMSHIAIFSCQVALTEVWRSFGIVPDAVIGQSVGEVAAAYGANFLSLEEAVNLIYIRSNILARQTDGSMAVIGNLDLQKVESMCSKHGNNVCIAVYSSPSACTISGSDHAIKHMTKTLKEDICNRKMFHRQLNVNCAYHSPLLDGCLDEIETTINRYFANSNVKAEHGQTIPMLSTVTGKFVVPEEMRKGRYWASNVRDPVLFMQSVKQIYDPKSFNVFLELGPRPVLRAHVYSILQTESNTRTIPSLSKNVELSCLYRSLTELYELGIDLNYSSLVPKLRKRVTTIPRYKFNRRGDLFIPTSVKDYLAGFSNAYSCGHSFVQQVKKSDNISFAISIDEKSTPFVYDHFLFDSIIVPGATYVEAGFHVGKQLLRKPVDKLMVAFNFTETFKPLIGKKHIINVQIVSRNKENVQFYIGDDGNILAKGTVSERKYQMRESFDIKYIKRECSIYKSRLECYKCLKSFHFSYGNSLSFIQGAWVSNSTSKCVAEIKLPDKMLDTFPVTHFHPAVIDSMFQVFGILVKDNTGEEKFFVPKGVDSVAMNKSVEKLMFVYAKEVKVTRHATFYNAVLLSKTGIVIAEIENFFINHFSTDLKDSDNANEYVLNWSEVSDVPDHGVDLSRVNLLTSSNDPELLRRLKEKCIIPSLYSNIEEILQERKTFSATTALVYHVDGLEANAMGKSGSFFFNSVTKRFLDVKKLLTSVMDLRIKPFITIITENTQLCPGRETINFTGSELWGMLRSAVHEGFNKNIKLVDVDRDKFDPEILSKLLLTPSHFGTEFAISGSKLYRATIQHYKGKIESRRSITRSKFDKMTLCSSSSKEVSEPYLMLVRATQDKDKSNVILESFSLHDRSLYLPTLEKYSWDLDLEKREEECQVIAVEGRGKTSESGGDIYFLHPVNASMMAYVPREHQIDKADCQTYLSGILILTNILFHITSKIRNGSNIMAVTQLKDVDIGQKVLMTLLSRKRCETRFLTIDALSKNYYSNVNVVLITTFMSQKHWKLVFQAFSPSVEIIVLSIHVKDDVEKWLYHTFPDKNITVLSTSQLFSSKRIGNAMPCIKDCLKNLDSNTLKQEANNFLLKLPMEDFHIREELEEETLNCFGNVDNIFRSNGSYLIVGGLTGLGWQLLVVMVKMGAGTLIPLSRRKPSRENQLKIEKLQRKYNCQIVPMQVDITEFERVERIFNDIQEKFPNSPIRGIFHGAGVVIDSTLNNLDERKIFDVMKPKVLGTWNLHVASLKLQIDFFVLHSSVVSVIGNPAQTNYSAANSFLDSFALYRRSIGLPAQSINWGALSTGMAVENNIVMTKLKRNGFGFLAKRKIRECFLKAMINDMTNVVFADIEWDKLLLVPTFSMQSLKYIELQTFRSVRLYESKRSKFDYADMKEKSSTEKATVIRNAIKEILREVVAIQNDSWTDQTTMAELGIDSMSATSLAVAINEAFKCRISILMLLSDETTIKKIVDFLLQSIEETLGNEETGTTVDDFDDDDTKKLFESKQLTYMQNDLITNYIRNKNDPYYLRVIDVEIFGIKLHIDEWKMILVHVLKLRPELRRKYMFLPRGGLTVEDISDKEIEVNAEMVSAEILEDSQVSDARMMYNPDIDNTIPICFKIAESENNTIFRIVTHALVIDMKGISLFCKDMENTLIAHLSGQNLPDKYPHIDVAATVKSSILSNIKELSQFWDNYTNFDLKPISLGKPLESVDINFCYLYRVNIPSLKVLDIMNYVTKQGISVYEFIMSLYQLFLFIGSNSPIIPVGTAADMRLHIPELNNVITRCTNYLPIIAHIDQSCTLTDFIRTNSFQISTATKHGAYPSSLILKKIKSAEAREHIFRHFLIMNDMTLINEISKDQIRAEIKRVWHIRPDRETFVYISHNLGKASLTLDIGYNSKICGRFRHSFSKVLLWFIDEAITSGDETIDDLRDKLASSSLRTIPTLDNTEPFEKYKEKSSTKTSTRQGNRTLMFDGGKTRNVRHVDNNRK